jgi:hypothetical protein
MATLFFDSSGLVKRYIAETGTAWIQSLNAPGAGHDRVIAEITGVEMTAAVTRRIRRGDTTPAEAAVALADIEVDFAGEYFLLETSRARVERSDAIDPSARPARIRCRSTGDYTVFA